MQRYSQLTETYVLTLEHQWVYITSQSSPLLHLFPPFGSVHGCVPLPQICPSQKCAAVLVELITCLHSCCCCVSDIASIILRSLLNLNLPHNSSSGSYIGWKCSHWEYSAYMIHTVILVFILFRRAKYLFLVKWLLPNTFSLFLFCHSSNTTGVFVLHFILFV